MSASSAPSAISIALSLLWLSLIWPSVVESNWSHYTPGSVSVLP
jgi:hypothetical protein